jgi:hypothetical protein
MSRLFVTRGRRTRAHSGITLPSVPPQPKTNNRSPMTDRIRRKVMLGNTSLDLPEHRKQAIEACLRMDCTPVVVDTLTAADANAAEKSLELVDQADIYLGLFAPAFRAQTHRIQNWPPSESPSPNGLPANSEFCTSEPSSTPQPTAAAAPTKSPGSKVRPSSTPAAWNRPTNISRLSARSRRNRRPPWKTAAYALRDAGGCLKYAIRYDSPKASTDG